MRASVHDRVAVLTLDKPPVNALSPDVWDRLARDLHRVATDDDVIAVVIIGGGRTFSAGADLNLFEAFTTREQVLDRAHALQTLLTSLEDVDKPLIAAIHGYALGAAFELALACHYRIATLDTALGFPEVTMGFIPGAGGTQRVTRLAGAAVAIALCARGERLAASRAQAYGIVDRCVDGPLLDAAIAYGVEVAATRPLRRTRLLAIAPAVRAAGLAACADARDCASAAGNSAAGRCAIDAIAAALTSSVEAGLQRERELCAECLLSDESRARRRQLAAARRARRA